MQLHPLAVEGHLHIQALQAILELAKQMGLLKGLLLSEHGSPQ
jgi:hypothetical protein